jgi:hypothetical protein
VQFLIAEVEVKEISFGEMKESKFRDNLCFLRYVSIIRSRNI